MCVSVLKPTIDMYVYCIVCTPDMYMYVYGVQCVLKPTINMYMYSSLHLTCTCMCVVIHNSK